MSLPEDSLDVVISNLVLHYIHDLDAIYQHVFSWLRPGGYFVINMEHPTFTAGIHQQFLYKEGRTWCWPVDHYFEPGDRKTLFCGQEVVKQHHTLIQILNGLLQAGFVLTKIEEAMPSKELQQLLK